MANITVLLREDLDNIGGRGDVVKVKAGYARNYLLPQKFATLATKGNVKQIEREREALLKRAAVGRSTAESQRDQMASISLAFERKAGEGGTLFGSVTSMDIAEALQAKGYETDRRKIVMKDAIKETGEFTVKVKLHRDVTLDIPVSVTAEGGEADAEKPAKKVRRAKSETDESTSDAGSASDAPVEAVESGTPEV